MSDEDEGIIVEFISIGNSVKVTAFDTVSLTEVSIVGSKRASRKQLSDLAIRKLRYQLDKERDA